MAHVRINKSGSGGQEPGVRRGDTGSSLAGDISLGPQPSGRGDLELGTALTSGRRCGARWDSCRCLRALAERCGRGEARPQPMWGAAPGPPPLGAGLMGWAAGCPGLWGAAGCPGV